MHAEAMGQNLRGERSSIWQDADRDLLRAFAFELKSANEVSAAARCDMEKAKEECAIGEIRGGIGDAKARSQCDKRYT